MLSVFPNYYKNFQCIAGACRHSCCIGWEIDIDPETLTYYNSVPGEMGARLRSAITTEETPHFRLGDGERCPFLNGDNLCDLILTLGEDHICGICTDHPRFRNELPGRVETGLGLCCEEAARLILSQQEPVLLEYSGNSQCEDGIITLRDQVISLLQNRSRTIPERVEDMLEHCGVLWPERTMEQWIELFLGLERLDESWTEELVQLREGWASADLAGFEAAMAARSTEYEQLLVYLVYRHMANAPTYEDVSLRAGFAALGYAMLHAMGAVIWTQQGELPFQRQVELARQFSSEIEYSDENLYLLMDEFL